MGKNNLELLITTAITIILVAALITSIASESQNKTTKTYVVNESVDITSLRVNGTQINQSGGNVTIANYPIGWQVEDCPITNFNISYNGTYLGNGVDYRFTATTGKIALLNNVVFNCTGTKCNNTEVYYSYCGDGYINTSWGRTLLNMTPAFIALALLVTVVVLTYLLLGKEGQED